MDFKQETINFLCSLFQVFLLFFFSTVTETQSCGPPPQYYPGPVPLNFGGQKRSGAFDMAVSKRKGKTWIFSRPKQGPLLREGVGERKKGERIGTRVLPRSLKRKKSKHHSLLHMRF
jgi:hypothetical protein